MFTMAQKLASIASDIPSREFAYAIECLSEIIKAWEQGRHVKVEVVNESSLNDHISDDSKTGYQLDNDGTDQDLDDVSDFSDCLSDIASMDHPSYGRDYMPLNNDHLADDGQSAELTCDQPANQPTDIKSDQPATYSTDSKSDQPATYSQE